MTDALSDTSSDTGVSPMWSRFIASATQWSPPSVDILVVVPHPDDETLSTGSLIAGLESSPGTIRVVAVTDGEAAYGPPDPALGRLRRGEQLDALDVLGIEPTQVTHLGLPDSAVAASEDDLVEALVDLVGPDTLIVAPWTRDVHPDHEACGRAARRVRMALGNDVVFSLFWAHHRRPSPQIDGFRAMAVHADGSVRRRVREALGCHRSQFEFAGHVPILDEDLVRPALTTRQIFVEEVES